MPKISNHIQKTIANNSHTDKNLLSMNRHVKRKNSGGFVLGIDGSCPSEAGVAFDSREAILCRDNAVDSSLSVEGSACNTGEEEGSRSGSSRYSFSSDYTSGECNCVTLRESSKHYPMHSNIGNRDQYFCSCGLNWLLATFLYTLRHELRLLQSCSVTIIHLSQCFVIAFVND